MDNRGWRMEKRDAEMGTFNIQHSTSNIEVRADSRRLLRRQTSWTRTMGGLSGCDGDAGLGLKNLYFRPAGMDLLLEPGA
jgi:hypothetical protein